MRIKVFNLSIIFVFLFLFFSLLNNQIIQGAKFKELSRRNCIRLIPQYGSRGNILDAQGNIIVGSSISYDVVIFPQPREEVDKTLIELSKILNISFKELKTRFITGFVAPGVPVTIAKNISQKKAVALEEERFVFGSVIVEPTTLRYYPYGKLASHVLGYISEIDRWRLTKLSDYGYKTKDLVGFGGVEEKYDYYLRQEDGGLSVEVDHRGRFTRVLGFKPPTSGKDLQLTLDLRIQRITEDVLGDKKGSVIVMNPENGEIMAMASSPGFSPDLFVKKSSNSIVGLFNNPDAPLLNRSISGVFPPGSVFKLIVAIAALETGKITLNTRYPCRGEVIVGSRQFNCWDIHGEENLLEAIAHSCNVFFYKTGLLIGAQLIHDYALRMGLSKASSIELPYEASGFVADPLWEKIYKFRRWYQGDTANFAIGQGELLATPLQLIRMMAVFANKGRLVSPYIVKAIEGKDVSIRRRRIADLHFKDNSINKIREGLRAVVSDSGGTAHILSGLPVDVAGKTGTAQTFSGLAHGWFLGFFPFQNPKFVICVFLEHGGSGYAATVVSKTIIESMIQQGLL
jgi:penicillin-binding protein 2